MPQPTNPPALAPVYIPGLSDLVSLGRATYETDADRRARQTDIANAIKHSAIPEWRQNMVGVMTKLDNLEDFATTLGLLGRAALHIAPRLTPVVRGILGVDAILTAAMVLMRVGYPGSTKKALVMARAKGNPAAMVTRAMDDAKPLKRIPTIGTALEVLQTTDWLFGEGIVIGPLFGALEETIARGTQAGLAAFEAGNWTIGQRDAWAIIQDIANRLPPIDPDLAGRAYVPVPLPGITDILNAIPGYQGAMRALEAFTGLTRPDSPFPQSDQLTIAGRGAAAAQLLGDAAVTGVKVNLSPYTIPLGTVRIPPMLQTHPVTLAVAIEAGADPTAPPTWLIPGNPTLATPDELHAVFAPQIRAWHDHHRTALGDSDLGQWLGVVVAQTTQHVGRALASSNLALEYPPEPSIKLAGLLLERDLIATPDPTPAQLHAVAAAAIEDGANPYAFSVPTSELIPLFAELGITVTSAPVVAG